MKFSELFNSRGLKIGSIGSLGIKFLGVILSFLVSVFLARYLGLTNYGVYVLVLSTIILLTIPLTMGIPLLITRFIPKYEVEANKGAIKGLLIRANQFIALSSLMLILIFIVIYFFVRNELSESLIKTFAWGMLLLPIMGYNEVRAATLRGLRYIVLGQLPDIFLRSLFLLIGILVFKGYFGDMKPEDAMALHALSAGLANIVAYLLLHKKLFVSLKGITPMFHSRNWMRESIQFSFNMGINKVKVRLSTYVLAAISGPAAVALYEVALKGSKLVVFGLTAINSALGPFISRAYEKNDFEELQRIITKATRVIFMFSLPVSLLFIIGGSYIIDVFYGEEFSGSYIPLAILCLGQLMNSGAGSVGLLLKMTGNQKYVLKVNTINTIANLLIAIPLVMYFDVIGAAIAYGVLLIVQNGIFVWYAYKKLSIRTTIV